MEMMEMAVLDEHRHLHCQAERDRELPQRLTNMHEWRHIAIPCGHDLIGWG